MKFAEKITLCWIIWRCPGIGLAPRASLAICPVIGPVPPANAYRLAPWRPTDTVSAVVISPLQDESCTYLSSGTWSLMGVESRTPSSDSRALALNITNEGGMNGRYRVLKNIMGLWLLNRITQELATADLPALLAAAAALRGISPSRLHIVGGGSQNHCLNQLTADCCQLPVSAGPVEASMLDNVRCQLIALNAVADVAAWRRIVTRSFPLAHYQPSPIPDFAHHWQRFQALCQTQEEILL